MCLDTFYLEYCQFNMCKLSTLLSLYLISWYISSFSRATYLLYIAYLNLNLQPRLVTGTPELWLKYLLNRHLSLNTLLSLHCLSQWLIPVSTSCPNQVSGNYSRPLHFFMEFMPSFLWHSSALHHLLPELL